MCFTELLTLVAEKKTIVVMASEMYFYQKGEVDRLVVYKTALVPSKTLISTQCLHKIGDAQNMFTFLHILLFFSYLLTIVTTFCCWNALIIK